MGLKGQKTPNPIFTKPNLNTSAPSGMKKKLKVPNPLLIEVKVTYYIFNTNSILIKLNYKIKHS